MKDEGARMNFDLRSGNLIIPLRQLSCAPVNDSSLSVTLDHEGPLFRAAVEQIIRREAQ
jgi:hypothetical protein